MWIKIKINGGPKFSIPIPLFMLRMPFVWNMIAKQNFDGKEIVPYGREVAAKAYSELRRYINTNGHFTLVDIQSSDGDIIKITV